VLDLLAGVFGKERGWFLDAHLEEGPATGGAADLAPDGTRPGAAMPMEPAFLFSRELLQSALPELLVQTGTSGAQFARLLVRVWQEKRHNEFPDIERAAEVAGGRQMPLSLEAVLGIARQHGLTIRWFDDERGGAARKLLRARFEAPATILINRKLRSQADRLKYTLAFFIGHRILHGGDGVIPPHSSAPPGLEPDDAAAAGAAGVVARDFLLAWRDFECSAFAGALLCPRQPFRQFLAREAHRIAAADKLGVTAAVMMRRMTAVSPYRHWHFFDAYAPGYLRAVYRGNQIPLPWGNMSVVPDACPHWAVFRLLQAPPRTGVAAPAPSSQISVMYDDASPRLFCCHSLATLDAAGTPHVLSVGVDLAPALAAQGFDAQDLIDGVADACRRRGGAAPLAASAARAIRTVAHVLNIAWIADGLEQDARIICARSRNCPRSPTCAAAGSV
jgi:hypothetical protein